MDQKDKIISFDDDLASVSEALDAVSSQTEIIDAGISNTSVAVANVLRELADIPGALIPTDSESENLTDYVESLNRTLNDAAPALRGDIALNPTDILVSVIAGVIAAVIDIVFVGTPEIVKLYRGGENFDGSILTGLIRRIGNSDGKLSDMLKWLSDKCIVSYDISLKKGIVIPNNHRLRSFGHDPLFGVLFAVVDIILGTATVVDDNGRIRIIVRATDYPVSEKYLALVYYLGHLISDVCTARGLPIPGFIVLQFFAGSGDRDSLAKIAERMYKDGYDLRHFASMSTPVLVKNLITDAYLYLSEGGAAYERYVRSLTAVFK